MDSSWYMLRYCTPQYGDGPYEPQVASDWMPVKQYTGGAEHAVMHLLYSRFFIKSLRDMGMLNITSPSCGCSTRASSSAATTRR